MFKRLKNLIHLRRVWRINRRFHQGYDWAAGRLLRGFSTAHVLENTERARDMGDYDDFDRGAEAAVRDWRKVMR